MKKIGIGIFVGIIAVAAVWYFLLRKGDVETIQGAELLEYKPIDKLFTSFAYVPLLDYEWGGSELSITSNRKVLLGYCWRQYEVGIGYDSTSTLFKDYLNAACRNEFDKLPEPEILSTNPVSSEAFGKYNRTKCDMWDKEILGPRMSRNYIRKQLVEDGQWEMIVDNSRKALASFIRIYCPERGEK